LRGGAVRLDSLLADDFLSIGEQGYVFGKQEWIGRYGDFRYLSVGAIPVIRSNVKAQVGSRFRTLGPSAV